MFYSAMEKEVLGPLCLAYEWTTVKKKLNFKETKNKVVVEIGTHLKRFKANKYPVVLMTCSQKM